MAKAKLKFLSQELIKEIEKARDIPIIIVEGKKDKQALEELDFNNVIVLHSGGKAIYSILDEIKGRECAILTDIDKKGREYYSTLKKELVKKGIKINDRFRKFLQREKISHIEGLATFVKHKTI